MSYGEELQRLNPLDPEELYQTLARFCPAGGRVLDVGCGRGATLAWLALHTDYRLQGVEPDPIYAAACGAIPGRAEQLPLADHSQDALLLECVFSLLDQPVAAAAEARRVLRPGGCLLLSDLYGRRAEAQLTDHALLRHIYLADRLSEFFLSVGFSLAEFTDHTFAMQSLLAQMIMDGAACSCLDPESRQQLRQAKAGYGLWVFQA